jgi:hypothetical protein
MEPSARQLQAIEAAEKTKELSIELHLATFAVAITIVLGSQVEKLVSEDVREKESHFTPDEVVNIIENDTISNGDADFHIENTALAHGLVVYIKYLNSAIGFGLHIVRSQHTRISRCHILSCQLLIKPCL